MILDTTYLRKIYENTKNIPSQASVTAEIFRIYGDNVEISSRQRIVDGKNESLNITTFEKVWTLGGFEVYPTTNAIDTISSSSASDTNTILIEGFTLSGGNFTFVSQTATLNGQSKVSLTTPIARATYLYNDNATDFVGSVYCYEDTTITSGVPDDLTKAHLKAIGVINQSENASLTLSSTEYGFITQVHGGVNIKKVGGAEFYIQIREPGKVFRSAASWVSSGDTIYNQLLTTPIIIPPNSDIRIIARSSVADLSVEAGFNLTYADIVT